MVLTPTSPISTSEKSEREDGKGFYLLKAKCRPIVRELGVPQGGLLCVRSFIKGPK
ncbi:hypothetical protein TSIB_1355 [Thermococcus sibiricus MM 739]|uniref:Uncharacterized protein n=1 Tax=Thermococcus sibiricus (strain DSM 12597 / MM 739) TaxID=604354 RepID=C6A462_THESM|nr:hypothetical protein TSIB_1355 [Thermococcus sibiricus MM 739]